MTRRVGRFLFVASAMVLGACASKAAVEGGLPSRAGTSAGSPSASPSLSPSASLAGPAWTYVALGDSVTSGYHSGGPAYPKLFAQAVQDATGHAVSVTNEAVDGNTSMALRKALQNDDDLRAEIADAQIVTVDIGGTDYDDAVSSFALGDCGGADGQECLRDAVQMFRGAFGDILDAIVELRTGEATMIRTVDIYQSHHNLHLAGLAGRDAVTVIGSYLAEFNSIIHKEARQHQARNAANFDAWNGPDGSQDPADAGLLAMDGTHPTASGQQAIADLLAALSFAPLD